MSDNIIYKLRSGKPIKALWFAQKRWDWRCPMHGTGIGVHIY